MDVSTQVAPHRVAPVMQTHFEFEQTCKAMHAAPQPPQLDGSFVVSTHCAPHSVWPLGHVEASCGGPVSGTDESLASPADESPASATPGPPSPPPRVVHDPFTHAPAPQLTPHEPQLAGSFLSSTQVFPQRVVPPAQSRAQAPLAHTSFGSHRTPQAPQFAGSCRTSTHRSPQAVAPPWHTNASLSPCAASTGPTSAEEDASSAAASPATPVGPLPPQAPTTAR